MFTVEFLRMQSIKPPRTKVSFTSRSVRLFVALSKERSGMDKVTVTVQQEAFKDFKTVTS